MKSTLHSVSIFVVNLTIIVTLLMPLSVRADTPMPESSTPPPQTGTNHTQDTPPQAAPPVNDHDPPTQDASLPSHSHTSTPQANTSVTANTPTTQSNTQTDTSINNTINSHAASGNASAEQNTTAGDVRSGNAAAFATIVNLLQSSVNLNGSQPIMFIRDVTGNVQGDLLIDPTALASSLNTTAEPLFGDLSVDTINTATQSTINNSIHVSASSGNASAYQNTTVGNVQSGSANAVANVVNIINSAINANQSFIGMINIYGNLKGNILVPAEFVDNVLGTGNSIKSSVPIVTTDNGTSATNVVSTNAQSGTATATNNTTTGNINSGTANTNVTILNLTSNQTVGKNALLVFVNILGSWVGLILDAPAGTTSASLGGNTIQNATVNNINTDNNLQIHNTINISAASGNATAQENTTTGNVHTGNANASANLLNVLNSQISLSDWFGILFINVFGEWTGNFGTQTVVDTTPPNNPTPNPNGGAPSSGTGVGGARTVFRFAPNNSNMKRSYITKPFRTTAKTSTATIDHMNEITHLDESVLGDKTQRVTGDSGHNTISLQTDKDKIENQGLHWWWLPFILLLAALLAGRYYIVRRRVAREDIKEEI